MFKGEYVAPRRVVYKEINLSSEKEINAAYDLFLSSGDFSAVEALYASQTKNPVSYTEKNPLIKEAFNLREGEVSSIVKKNNGSFSFILVERFLEEVPYTLNRVYNQIERKIKKTQQDSLKKNLLSSLKKKYNLNNKILLP